MGKSKTSRKVRSMGAKDIALRTVLYIILSAAIVAFILCIFYLLMFQDSKIADKLIDSGFMIAAFIAIVVMANVVVIISLIIAGKPPASGAEAASGAPSGRFGSLSEIDFRMSSYKAPEYSNSITLSQLCTDFRNFAASRYGLYYDIQTVRSFVAALPVTRLIIMQGISGTGKTSLAWAFGEYIGQSSAVIPVQPSWKEKTDLLGYFNEFTNTFNETEFLRRVYGALYTDDVNVIVLDEMNIARVEYYFAEFLSLLEIRQTESRIIDLTSAGWPNDPKYIEGGRMKIPDNIWYIGTANNDDSTMAISDKVYDRAMVLELDKRAEPFDAPNTSGVCVSYSHIMELGEEAKKNHPVSDKARKEIYGLDKYMTDNLGISFGNRIMRQLEEFVPVYISAGGTEYEAIDIMVSRKVLRKLENKNPLQVKRCVQGFIAYLDDIFGENEMPLCRKTLYKYNI